jgi:hypothetical protein
VQNLSRRRKKKKAVNQAGRELHLELLRSNNRGASSGEEKLNFHFGTSLSLAFCLSNKGQSVQSTLS